MIIALTGTLQWQSPTQLVLFTEAGVAYELLVSMYTHDKLKDVKAEGVLVYTYLQVKDNPATMCLYGFAGLQERSFFLQLISVSGIGPALALRILSASLPEELASHIIQGQTSAIKRIKGIGSKIAERLVLELKDCLVGFTVDTVEATPSAYNEALAALVQLGVKEGQAKKQLAATTQRLSTAEKQSLSAEELIKLALSQS